MHIYRKNGYSLKYISLAALLCLICFGCAKKAPLEKMAIRINDYSLSSGEFNELLSELGTTEDTPEMSEVFLENLINRKLLLQEAQKEGLDKEDDFLKAIENFWEQSLLTIIIDKKVKEVSGSIGVSEQEIQDYYDDRVKQNPDAQQPFDDGAREAIRLQILRQKETEVLDSWVNRLRDNAKIVIDKKALGIE